METELATRDTARQLSDWQGAWRLARHELKKDAVGLLVTLLFIVYVLILVGMGLADIVRGEAEEIAMVWMIDVLQLSILPVVGFPMNRTLFRAWREDSFTEKIMQWRIMPISVRQIVLARNIQLILLLSFSIFIYFTALYLAYSPIRGNLELGPYIGYALFWYGCAIGISSTYVYWEQGHSGKLYTVASFTYVAIYLIVAIVLGYNEISITRGLLDALREGNWSYSVGALIGGIGLMLLMYLAIGRRIRTRSYTR